RAHGERSACHRAERARSGAIDESGPAAVLAAVAGRRGGADSLVRESLWNLVSGFRRGGALSRVRGAVRRDVVLGEPAHARAGDPHGPPRHGTARRAANRVARDDPADDRDGDPPRVLLRVIPPTTAHPL